MLKNDTLKNGTPRIGLCGSAPRVRGGSPYPDLNYPLSILFFFLEIFLDWTELEFLIQNCVALIPLVFWENLRSGASEF